MNGNKPDNPLGLLVIGLDGATFDVIQPMIAAGELPNLAALMAEGTSGCLESTTPPFSPPAWTSFMTGVNPGRHGIFGFINFNPASYTHLESKSVTSHSLAGHTFFDLLSQAGYRQAVLTVPITYPAWPIEGYMVSGAPCPDTEVGRAYPEDFAAGLQQRYTFPSTFWGRPNDEIITGLYDMLARRTELALHMMEEKELDMMVVVFGATDRAQHNFWRYYDSEFGASLNLPREGDYEDVIPEVYRRADAAIGRLLARLGHDTTVFVISDHGGGPAATQYFHTNAWLRQQGLLEVKQGQETWVGSLRRAVLALRRALGARIEHRLRNMMPNRFVEQGRALVRNVAHINWPATRAYRFPMYPPAEGIVINVAGRQPQGIVQPGREYEQVREQIIEEARQLINPLTGEPAVVRACKREDLYHGHHLERAPDIVLVLSEQFRGGTQIHLPLVTAIDPALLDKVNGEHRMNGILIARGPNIRPGAWIKNAALMDLAPTILHTLGEPVPLAMDGEVLEELFTPRYRAANPVQYSAQRETGDIADVQTGLRPEEEEQIRSQLERLGYL